MNPLEDDDISHDSEAYRRWKGGTDTPQSEYLGKGPHPTAGLDTALPLAFMSFFATAWCSFLIVFNVIGGEGGPPFLFIQIFMVPFYGVGYSCFTQFMEELTTFLYIKIQALSQKC